LPKSSKIKFAAGIVRIIDANINRTREGLRVCEDITRFIIESPGLTAGLKEIRHAFKKASQRLIPASELLGQRDSSGDIGRDIYGNELKRKDCRDIFFANIQRAKESIRVLEEFAKLRDKNISVIFKRIRYRLYEIEKRTAKILRPS
jgi:thiamine-phosphate pyrophosphorylase